jgi:hypothetical protein
MTLNELYKSLGQDGEKGESACALLSQTHWFSHHAVFDPKTGEALPQSVSDFLEKMANPPPAEAVCDRLWRITEHVRPAITRLFRSLNESPRREQSMMPVHAVRELDANSFIKLSNRPGRNIREKLAGKPYLQAVRRFQSIDLPENRLLKAFVMRLVELLEVRRDCLHEEDKLLAKIQLWLRSDDAKLIGRWNNLPPNNTLLSHRDYRRIWDAWCRVQTLDEDITRDFSQLKVRAETMRLWIEYGEMYLVGSHRFADMPVLFDYEKFEIRPWVMERVVQKATPKITRNYGMKEIVKPVCIDLTYLHPRYADTTKASSELCDVYLWQQWKRDNALVDIELFNSDAAYLHSDATTISSPDLFFSTDHTPEHRERLDRAARAFTHKLHLYFKNEKLIWLVPDFLNDFELPIIRRNINARFPNAEPLPRSVAAVFEQVDYSKIKNDGFSLVVVDTIGGRTCVTKLIARLDQELRKRLPEINGFYWERLPSVIISIDTEEGEKRHNNDMITIDDQGQWRDQNRQEKPQLIQPNTLKFDSRIGQFDFCINLTESPVVGGIRVQTLQQRAGNIPLWRDHLPELSFKDIPQQITKKFFWWADFNLVKDVPVIPIRGKTTDIPINRSFTLPANPRNPQDHYRFGLSLGKGNKQLQYDAYLKSKAFPLKQDTECKLKMTYTYGANDPYKLVFIPLDSEKAGFNSVKVKWRSASENRTCDLKNLPIPDFPARKNWSDFQSFPERNGESLLAWVSDTLQQLDPRILYEGKLDFIFKKELEREKANRVEGHFEWGAKDKKGNEYCRVMVNGDSIFCHSSNFSESISVDNLREGQAVFLKVMSRGDGKYGMNITFHDQFSSRIERNILTRLKQRIPFNESSCLIENADRLVKQIFSIRFPTLTIWNHEHSLSESGVPDNFRKAIFEGTQRALSIIESDSIPDSLKEELFFFLSCLHKDAPKYVSNRLLEIANNLERWPGCHRNIAFSIGGADLAWQEELLFKLLDYSHVNNFSGSLAVEAIAIALWRSEKLVHKFSKQQLEKLAENLSIRLELDLKQLSSHVSKNRVSRLVEKGLSEEEAIEREREYQFSAVCKHLELLLALLRSRGGEDDDFKMILAPEKKMTQRYVTLLDEISRIVIEEGVELKSRIELIFKDPKPEPFRNTPDLLYALRVHLTGDSGASSIIVSGVQDAVPPENRSKG